jgi:hypothetical protein
LDSELTVDLDDGESYEIIVEGYGDSEGDFTLSISDPDD